MKHELTGSYNFSIGGTNYSGSSSAESGILTRFVRNYDQNWAERHQLAWNIAGTAFPQSVAQFIAAETTQPNHASETPVLKVLRALSGREERLTHKIAVARPNFDRLHDQFASHSEAEKVLCGSCEQHLNYHATLAQGVEDALLFASMIGVELPSDNPKTHCLDLKTGQVVFTEIRDFDPQFFNSGLAGLQDVLGNERSATLANLAQQYENVPKSLSVTVDQRVSRILRRFSAIGASTIGSIV